MNIFTAVFLLCNTATSECEPMPTGYIFNDLKTCEAYKEASIQAGYEAIGSSSVLITGRCINWGVSL